MNIEYIITGIVIIGVIILQVRSLIPTLTKIKNYKNIFPDDNTCKFGIDDSEIPIKRIRLERIKPESSTTLNMDGKDEKEGILTKIIDALNSYLSKNVGAANDFHLMKDVVERYCDAEEEEISSQQPIPLYLGLIGTIVGIIVGISIMSGELDSSVSGQEPAQTVISSGISSLMLCVAIAMIASFVGVLSTTLIAWKYKSATVKVEEGKNRFYSWIQTELMPSLSGNISSAVFMLQQNLANFNKAFGSNIGKLDMALAYISSTAEEQTQLIQEVKTLNVSKFATANVKILQNLQSCLGQIQGFTSQVEVFKNYLANVYERESKINEVIAKLDDTLKQALESLINASSESINIFRSEFTKQIDALPELLTATNKDFREALQSQQHELIGFSNRFEKTMEQRSEKIDAIIKQAQTLNECKESISTLSGAINAMTQDKSIMQKTDINTIPLTIPKYIKIGILVYAGVFLLLMVACFVVSICIGKSLCI